MRKIVLIITLFTLVFVSCNNDDDASISNVLLTLNFGHNWDGTKITSADFNTIQYTNANGEQISIERLRYLISNVILTKSDGSTIVINEYELIDLTNDNSTFSVLETIPTGTYTNVSFTFGFKNEDNIDGTYTDLNSASFNVPAMLGGGYHYMQFDGKFRNSTSTIDENFNYHTIRAVDNPGANPTFPQDTFFTVNLGEIIVTNTVTLNVEMNIAEWFKNPNTWDLNVLNTVLMPNSAAQIMMHQNGQSVFSLGSVSQ